MTIHKSVQYSVYCDSCDDLIDYQEFKNQREAKKYWRSYAWKSLPDGKWMCPRCQETRRIAALPWMQP
jgi:hypothetical protein